MIREDFLSEQIKNQIRSVTILTQRLLSGLFIGDNRSAQKGIGFDFNTIREYQEGDDIRCIDWTASSRSNTLLVKEYKEERNSTIFLAVDISASSSYGSQKDTKKELYARIGTILALVAHKTHEKIGLILYSDRIEKYIAPSNSKGHIYTIIKELLSHQSIGKKTNTTVALRYLLNLKKKNAIVFFISDFIDESLFDYFAPVSKMYDCIAIRVLDIREKEFPNIGFITTNDIETGESITLDMRCHITNILKERIGEQTLFFKKNQIELVDIMDPGNIINDLVTFLCQRMK